ncbi:MAG: TldD/PmbA family protein [Candidatus Heimdallarchaeota archaeon]|nr:TldD/PmbA family protein [Candidatus Heimdallarchaeota archaeon]
MVNYDKLIQIGENALDICQKEGAEQAEVFVTKKNLSSLSTSFKEQQFNSTSSQSESIIGLAVSLKMNDDFFGFTHSSDFDKESLQEIIHGAAKAAVKRTGFSGFITNGGSTDVQKLYDPAIREFINDPSSLKEIILRTNNKATTFNDIYLNNSSITAVEIDTIIMNTNGIKLTNTGSFFSFALNTIHKSNDPPTQTYRHIVKRTLEDLAVEQFVTEAAEESQLMSKKIKIDEITCPAIFTARAASDLYGYQFDPSVGLHGVTAGFSKLSDKIGDEVASSELTLYDDATLPGGQYSNAFDDEGSPTKKTIIIEKGILKSFLSNSYFATRNNSITTSNCARRATRQINNYYTREFTYRPTVCTTNFCILPGNASDDELVTEMKDGLIVNIIAGGITVVDLGGEFNVQGMHIYKVEKGEIIGTINDASVKGNWYQIFKDIQLVSSKPEYAMSSLGATSYVWPKMLIRELKFKPM